MFKKKKKPYVFDAYPNYRENAYRFSGLDWEFDDRVVCFFWIEYDVVFRSHTCHEYVPEIIARYLEES